MGIFERRFLSKQDFGRLVLATTFSVHFWAVIQFLRHFPALVLHLRPALRPAEIWGVLAYVLGGALVETVLTAGVLFLLAALLPYRFLRAHFAAAASLIGYIPTGGAVSSHYTAEITSALITLTGQSDFLNIYLGVLGGVS